MRTHQAKTLSQSKERAWAVDALGNEMALICKVEELERAAIVEACVGCFQPRRGGVFAMLLCWHKTERDSGLELLDAAG